jgi:hypothetical protein
MTLSTNSADFKSTLIDLINGDNDFKEESFEDLANTDDVPFYLSDFETLNDEV